MLYYISCIASIKMNFKSTYKPSLLCNKDIRSYSYRELSMRLMYPVKNDDTDGSSESSDSYDVEVYKPYVS